jgi:hypothetical protein
MESVFFFTAEAVLRISFTHHHPLKTDEKSQHKYKYHFPACNIQLLDKQHPVYEVRTKNMFLSKIFTFMDLSSLTHKFSTFSILSQYFASEIFCLCHETGSIPGLLDLDLL